MDGLFKEVEPGQLVLATSVFKLKGKAKYVFEMLRLLATTEILENDVYWWAVRAEILGRDRDLQFCPEVGLRFN